MSQPTPPNGPKTKRSWTGLYVPDSYDESPPHDIGPLTAEEYEKIVVGLAQFRDHPEILRIWEFNTAEGELQGLSIPPGTSRIANTDCWTLCPFVPGKLLLHSPRALRAGVITLRIGHTVLLDSNLYNRIVGFVEDPAALTSGDQVSVRRLLKFVIDRKYDYQLLPYVVESFAKNLPERGREYAFRGTRAILQLHTMDKDHFRATGLVRLDPRILEDYQKDFGTTDLDQIVAAQLVHYAAFAETPPEVTLSFICLLKMVIIHRSTMPTRDFDTQWKAFDDFIFGRLGAYAGSMRLVALFYFAGKLDGWIRTHRNSNSEAALDALSRCAWDFYLATIVPQRVLAESPEEEIVALCHFCSRDQELASVLSLSLLQMLTVRADGGLRPYFTIDLDRIRAAVGAKADVWLAHADERALHFIESREAGQIKRIEWNKVDSLLAEVTEEFHSAISR